MDKKSPVFEKTYQSYLKEIAGIDLAERAERLGAEMAGNDLIVPLLGRAYRVSPKGVDAPDGNRAGFSESVAIFKYILMCPPIPPMAPQWVTYREFKDARPLLNYFTNNCLRPVEERFSGKVDTLEQACRTLGGRGVHGDTGYDLSMQVDGFPKIPVLLNFNDMDDDFSARCIFLFQRSAEAYLDMESVAIIGVLFATRLITQLQE
jgi:hypothetical protein